MKLTRFSGVKSGRACNELMKVAGIGTETIKLAKQMSNNNSNNNNSSNSNINSGNSSKSGGGVSHIEPGSACFVICGVDMEGVERELGFEATTPESCKVWIRHLEA